MVQRASLREQFDTNTDKNMVLKNEQHSAHRHMT